MPTTDRAVRPNISADDIREYVVTNYLEPAREAGNDEFTVRIGDIMKALPGITGVSHPCAALRAEAFAAENSLTLTADRAPPSGLGYNVWLTFSLGAGPVAAQSARGVADASPALRSLLAMQGVGKEFYARHGGGEAVLAAVREGWT